MTTPLSGLGAAMPTSLGPIGLESPTGGGSVVGGTGSASSTDFSDMVSNALDEVQGLSDRASTATDGYLSGEHQDVHGTMIAMQEADVSLRLAANVRNRAIEAYREVMRMGS